MEQAFAGHQLQDILLFLRLAYTPVDFSLARTAAAVGEPAYEWQTEALIELAAKLDASAVMQVGTRLNLWHCRCVRHRLSDMVLGC